MGVKAGRLRSVAEFYRPGETRNARGASVLAHTRIGQGWVGVEIPRRTIGNYGAGEMPAGTMEMTAHGAAPLAQRDVVRITAGPESGTAWRVETVHRTGNGELLASVVPYNEPLEVV